jgi:Uma2 family endonuclease
LSTKIRFTTSDLELLPDIEGTRYEIIDGELHVSKQPDWEHQAVCTEIIYVLKTWNDRTGAGQVNLAPGLIFTPEEAVAPDIVWISRERKAAALGDDGKLHAAPDLVVEVLSPGSANARRDRELKLKLYSLYGVREYWIADWRARSLQQYRHVQGVLQLIATLVGDDALTSPLLPGFSCPLSDLWGPTR